MKLIKKPFFIWNASIIKFLEEIQYTNGLNLVRGGVSRNKI